METQFDYKKFAILYVDDEIQSLSLFQQAFGDEFRIFTAATAQEGLKALERHPDDIGILMTDQRMPGEKGVWLLERARQLRPRILRILVTAYTDMEAAIQAVNTGAIYKYVNKPWDPAQLEVALKQGLEFFMVQAERDQLLREKKSLLRERMIASRVVSLGLVSAGLNHHIGNRLLSVNTFLELIETGALDQELLHKSRTDIGEILGLLNDLQVASNGRSNSQLADDIQLRAAVVRALEKAQPALDSQKITVEIRIPENLPVFRSSQTRFCRLMELLFKYELGLLPCGSVIKLSAAEAPVNGKPGLTFTLQDNGPTQPQDTLRLVLDPLVVHGNPSEYSINLMVCFFIVNHHGGFIEVGGLSDGGNRFTIHLPLEPEPSAINQDEVLLLEKVLRNDLLWDKFISGR
jgi:two-component system probable response regulator PhcQ